MSPQEKHCFKSANPKYYATASLQENSFILKVKKCKENLIKLNFFKTNFLNYFF